MTCSFENTGALNSHVFPDHLYLPSKVTDNVTEIEADVGECEEENDEQLFWINNWFYTR